WRTHTLIWRNKTNLEDQSLDDLFNNLKIYEAEVKSSSSTSPTTQNIAFVSSQNTDNTIESVSVVASVSAASTKVPVSALPNVDTLSNAVIYSLFASQSNNPHLDNDDLKQIDADELKEMDLKWQMAMLTMRARRKGHFARECRSPKDTRRSVPMETQRRNVPVETSTSNALVSQCDGLRDNALVDIRKKFEKAEQERDELKLKLDKFQTSLKNLSQLLASQTNDKTGLGYDNQGEGYHAVPPPYTGIFMPLKPDLVFHDDLIVNETVPTAFNVEPITTKPTQDLSQSHRPSAPIIEDWVFDSEDDYEENGLKTARNHAQKGNHQHYATMTHPNPHRLVVPTTVLTRSKLVPLTAARPVTTAAPYNNVIRPKPTKTVDTKPHSPPRRTINHRPSPPTSNFPQKVTTVKTPKVNAVKGVKGTWVWKPKCPILDHVSRHTSASMNLKQFDYTDALGRSKHMIGNMSYLTDFEEINGGNVAFGGNPKGGKITGKGKIRTGKLDFDDVYFVKELKFNLSSISQIYDKKNSVLFTDTECIVLFPEFKLPDENQVLHRVPRKNNMYNVDLKNIVPSGDLTCLFAKATLDESNLWHKRLGHINFKTMNKLVKSNLVRGLPSKVFENNHTCVACKKGKQHRASCKSKPVSSVSQPIQRKNMTLIEAARTMLADSLLPILFWAEAVNTSCYVRNRILVTKPHNKTRYELLLGRTPSIGFMRPFGYPMSILNTLDPLGKFDGKADEGFLVGYSVSSKAFRVFDNITRIIQETLHINFLENQPNVAGSGPTWMFDIDTLTKFMNYQPVTTGNQPNPSAGIQEHFDVDKAGEGNVQQYMLFPLWSSGSKDPQNTDDDTTFEVKEPESAIYVSPSSSAKTKKHDDKIKREAKVPAVGQISTNSTNTFRDAGPYNTVDSPTLGKSSYVDPSQYPDDPNMPALEDITYSDDEEDVGAETDFSNLETSITVSLIPTTRVHKDHPVTQIIEEPKRVHQALKDPSWIEAMLEELLHFKMQKVWVLVDLPKEKRAIGSKWEEGIDYEEVFAPVARIEAIRLFLAYASFMGFMVYQMDVKSAFLYRTIEEEVYVCQHLGFKDLDYPDKVYVDDIIFGSTNKDLCKAFEKLMKDKFQMSSMGELTFFLDRKSASTPIDTEKPLLKDPDVCGCARFQVTPKASHLHAVKRIFRYLKGKPYLGLWYPKDSPFNLVAYLDSDYAGASLDRKSTIGGCQFFRCRLISWQCKKQTAVATSSTEVKYIAAASCCAQVLWIQNQLLDYRKKVLITEDIIRQALRLDVADSIDCLPNEEIFAELARMGYKKPSTKLTFYKAFFLVQWKFLIHTILQCRKFSFSKYIFDSLVRNVDSSLKFYMYPRFLQLMISAQVGDLTSHTTKYSSPALTQKVFANMRRVGKGFFGVNTPLFEGMLVPQQAADDVDDVVADNVLTDDVVDVVVDDVITDVVTHVAVEPTPPSPTPTTTPPPPQQEVTSTSPPSPQSPIAQPSSPPQQPQPSQPTTEISMDLLNTLKLERKNKLKVSGLRILKKVGTAQKVESSTNTVMDDQEDASKHGGIIALMDADGDVTLEEVDIAKDAQVAEDADDDEPESSELKEVIEMVTTTKLMTEVVAAAAAPITAAIITAAPKQVKRKEKEDNVVLRYQALKRKPQTEAHARKNMMVYLKNMAGFKIDFFKGMSYDDIRPIFENSEEKAAKKQKLDEEVEELKKHIQIMLNDKDDVYTEATPLALKVPVVDYEIHTEHNKPYYKIIRADGTHQLFLSFLSLLRNFDREDLEMLWKLVQERFASSKPNNFSDDFLLGTLKVMFEKPDVEAQVWKNQRGIHGLAKVKSWRLLESCGVHIITFTTTQMILLVERKYPLTMFTLDQMLNNVRFEVEEESKCH
nr:hypothetical protein [Tanacetum cinerariifolium]